MDLSQPYIAIRERTLLELFDLTLHVYRDHLRNILSLLAINALPFILIDAAVIFFTEAWLEDPSLSLVMMMLLVFSQFQIGTLLITQYLGTATFSGKPSVGQTIKDFWSKSKYWIWNHGFIRMVFPILAVVALLQHDGIGLIIFLLFIGLIPRAFRPFISEVLILEQPARRQDKTSSFPTITLGKRNSSLHRGDVFSGFFMASVIGGGLLIAIVSLFFQVDSAIGLNGAWDSSIHFAYWPLAAWLTASFLATFRFLYYINTRINQEGWEISLKLMAEKQKLLAKDNY